LSVPTQAIERGEVSVEDPREKRLREMKEGKTAARAAGSSAAKPGQP